MTSVSPTIKSTRNAALWYADQGWAIFPVWPMFGKICRCGKQGCHSPGKHPVTYVNSKPIVPNGKDNATTNEGQINTWWNLFPGWNIGTASHFRIDVDTKNNGTEHWRELLANNSGYDNTPICKTPSGGQHIYFKSGDNYGNTNQMGDLPSGIDVRGNGAGYTILPPSNHQLGIYTWLDNRHPRDIAIANAPQWLIDIIGKDENPATAVAFSDSAMPDIEKLRIGAIVKALIAGDRSRVDLCVITSLARARLSDDEIRAVFQTSPPTTKYAEKTNGQGDKYLALTIGKARKWLKEQDSKKYRPVEDSV